MRSEHCKGRILIILHIYFRMFATLCALWWSWWSIHTHNELCWGVKLRHCSCWQGDHYLAGNLIHYDENVACVTTSCVQSIYLFYRLQWWIYYADYRCGLAIDRTHTTSPVTFILMLSQPVYLQRERKARERVGGLQKAFIMMTNDKSVEGCIWIATNPPRGINRMQQKNSQAAPKRGLCVDTGHVHQVMKRSLNSYTGLLISISLN